jgi:hypothetical protein
MTAQPRLGLAWGVPNPDKQVRQIKEQARLEGRAPSTDERRQIACYSFEVPTGSAMMCYQHPTTHPCQGHHSPSMRFQASIWGTPLLDIRSGAHCSVNLESSCPSFDKCRRCWRAQRPVLRRRSQPQEATHSSSRSAGHVLTIRSTGTPASSARWAP